MDIKQFLSGLHIQGTIIQVGTPQQVLGVDKLGTIIETHKDKDLFFLANIPQEKQYSRVKDIDMINIPKRYWYFDYDIRKDNKSISDEQIKWIGLEMGDKLKATPYKDFYAIVYSGNGLHIYYKGDPVEIKSLDDYSLGYNLMRADIDSIVGYESDSSCSNVARIARLPGSYNLKRDKPVLVEVVAVSDTPDCKNLIQHFIDMGKKENVRLKEIEKEEVALQELATLTNKYKADDLHEIINEIPVYEEVLKDFPQWSFDGKNFYLPNKKIATSAYYVKDGRRVSNALVLSETRHIPISQKAVSTFLYRREFSKLTSKETYEYFKTHYPNLKGETKLEGISVQQEMKVKPATTKYTWGTNILNHTFGLIKRGNYVLIAADTGVGKTTYALFQARKNAEMGNKVLYLSLEMNNEEIYESIARKFAGYTVEEEYKDDISPIKKDKFDRKVQDLKSMPNFYLSGVPKGTPVDMEFVEEQIVQHKPDILYVDNFDLVDRASLLDENTNAKNKSQKFMYLASTYNIPVVVIHHNRKRTYGSKGARTIDDVGGSGKITDDADRILLLSRPAGEEEEDKAALLMHFVKGRVYEPARGKVYLIKGDFHDVYSKYIL